MDYHDGMKEAPPSHQYSVHGTAARSRITSYRPNHGQVKDRSLDELLRWAGRQGVDVPEYVKVISVDEDFRLMKSGTPVDAKYFEAKDVPEGEWIYWDESNSPYRSLLSREFAAVVVNVSCDAMQNDERFLHVLAHEVFEVEELKKLFDDCGGRMPVSRFYELTEPLVTARNLHWRAWERADNLIERLRGNEP